ncbi:MAG: insulinase family protein [Proteobacteria bacterium]|nr:insulinase family protein [Pseudomonadota bacterium]
MVSIQSLTNGLTVIIDEMPHVESVAYDLILPGGVVCDDERSVGSSLILAELTSRGAGPFSSRDLSDEFDRYGIAHGEAASADRFAYRGSLLAEHLDKALELLSHMVLRPALPSDEVDDIRRILLQDISSLTDNPSRWVFSELTRRYFPAPYGRPSFGTKEGLEATTIESLRSQWADVIGAGGAIFSVAGKVRAPEVLALVEKHLGSWKGVGVKLPKFGGMPEKVRNHVQHNAAQLQIALAYPSAPFSDKDFYTAKVASQVLSGGMFGRLFIEVREKRGLCYSVYARHSATCDYGVMTAYAGTTPERAHETLDVMLGEFSRMKGTVTEEELARAKANLKASLIMGEESAGSRASSNAGDYWLGKKVRCWQEIMAEVGMVSAAALDQFFDRFPVDGYSLVTLGSRAIS